MPVVVVYRYIKILRFTFCAFHTEVFLLSNDILTEEATQEEN